MRRLFSQIGDLGSENVLQEVSIDEFGRFSLMGATLTLEASLGLETKLAVEL